MWFLVAGFWSIAAWKIWSSWTGYKRNRKLAERTGFLVIDTPLPPAGVFNIVGLVYIVPLFLKIPWTRHWEWLHTADNRNTWNSLRETNDRLNTDTYVFASPSMVVLRTTDAELIAQFAARKNVFQKPVKNYTAMDIFGPNILTTEGEEWKRHRRVVGPGFNDKGNGLVWKESLREAKGMIALWGRKFRRNGETELRVPDTSGDTAELSLHVICAAGFGVPQLWHGEDEKIQGTAMPNLNPEGAHSMHKMAFKEALNMLLGHLVLMLLWPQKVLEYSPWKVGKDVNTAFKETYAYLRELVEYKKKQMALGEDDNETMDLMGNMLRASEEVSAEYASEKSKKDDAPLSESEIISDAFIFLLAGHDTTATSIHFCFVYLAMHIAEQRRMQADIDGIVGTRPSTEWTYNGDFQKLYNSMVGAVLSEELRLMPIAGTVPKTTIGDQIVTVGGREVVIPNHTHIQFNTIGTNRNPKYYPHSKSKRTGKDTDLDDFVPERWLVAKSNEEQVPTHSTTENQETFSFTPESSSGLYKPPKGAYISFSEGHRACPGKKFALVELTAVLAVIFQEYSVELDVQEWASDEEIEKMGDGERKKVYEKAIERAHWVIRRCTQASIVLKMRAGDTVPLRFVKRGGERFAGLY